MLEARESGPSPDWIMKVSPPVRNEEGAKSRSEGELDEAAQGRQSRIIETSWHGES